MTNTPLDMAFLDDDGWRAFFASYDHIILIGNSEAAQPLELRKAYPGATLFVFFNKVYKILDADFGAPCLLVSRSGAMGANIVHRREVDSVLRFFPGNGFQGVLNVRVDPSEKFSPTADFAGASVRHLDLAPLLEARYPSGKIATSGFALTLWLLGLRLPAKIVLAGFSAKRSEKWKVFDVHDWSFEQMLLRIRAGRGDIAMLGQGEASRLHTLFAALPDVPREEILTEAVEVLANRLDDANRQIDRLMSLTKFQRMLDQFFRRLRPKTRKQRMLDGKSEK